MKDLVQRFCDAMGGEWVVESYGVDDDDGKLIVTYRSLLDDNLSWSHKPFNRLDDTPKIGTIGMLGFIPRCNYPKMD